MGGSNIQLILGWLAIGLLPIIVGVLLFQKSIRDQKKLRNRYEELLQAQDADTPASHEYEFLAELHQLQDLLQPRSLTLRPVYAATGAEAWSMIGSFLILAGGFTLGVPLILALLTWH